MYENEIQSSSVDDGDLKRNSEFKGWIESLSSYVRESLGQAPIIRLGAYRFGGTVGIAIDLFAAHSDQYCVNITAILSQNEIYLAEPRADQLDIVLPGILDIFHLIESLQNQTQGQLRMITM